LVNNAALGSAGGKVWNQNNTITEVFYVNHLAVTYLTQKMLPVLLATPNSRIVDVASGAHAAGVLSLRDFGGLEVKDSQMQLYGASKAANIVHARHLARLLDKCGVSTKVFSLHPGIIRTELHRNDPALNQYLVWVLHMLIAITPWQGAQNTIHLATTMDPAVLNTSGAYYSW
jgi:NAD(P)-dependent dehydrogenase (short-subunit alcohol dehydrogenase family)